MCCCTICASWADSPCSCLTKDLHYGMFPCLRCSPSTLVGKTCDCTHRMLSRPGHCSWFRSCNCLLACSHLIDCTPCIPKELLSRRQEWFYACLLEQALCIGPWDALLWTAVVQGPKAFCHDMHRPCSHLTSNCSEKLVRTAAVKPAVDCIHK